MTAHEAAPPSQMSPDERHARLVEWFNTRERLATLKTSEVLQRKVIAPAYFPSPEEGTNRADIGGGYDLVYVYNIDRKVDEDALDAALKEMHKKKIAVDKLFKYEPILSVSEYRLLTEVQKELVDSVLLSKPQDTPQLSVKLRSDSDTEKPPVAIPQNAPDTSAPTDKPEYAMSGLADGVPYEDFIKIGWTDEQLIAHGYMVAREPEGPPKPPAKKRGGGRRKKAAAAE